MLTYGMKGVTFTGDLVKGEGAHTYIANVIIPEREEVAKPGKPNVEIPEVSSSTIRLTWERVDTAFQYKIYRNGVFLITTNDLFYLDMGLRPSTEYTYEVSAVNKVEGDKSSALSRTTASDTQDLSEGSSLEKILSGGDVHYYEIPTVDPDSIYDVFWQDADTDQNYTANIQVGAKISKDSPTYLVFLTDSGNRISVSPPSNGPIFIVVQGFTTASSGRYTIRYTKRSKEEEIARPNAPEHLQASSTTAQTISLTWDSVLGASYYKIYRNYTSDGTYTEVGSVPIGTTYTDTGLLSNRTYYYRVTAVNSKGEESEQSSSFATTLSDVTVPSAPTGITATAFSTSITVSWYSSGAMSYKVYRSDWAYGTYMEVGSPTTGTTYTDTGLSPYTTYYYTVKAVNSDGVESEQSSYAFATTLSDVTVPSAPTGVTATPLSSNSISVSWFSVSGATSSMSYKVYRDTYYNGTYMEAGSSTTTTYTDTELSPNTTYYYKVSAVNSEGVESAQSSYASATTSSSSIISNITYSSVSGGEWTLQGDGRRKSPTISHGSVTKARISFTSTSSSGSITIQLEVSSESGYDFAFISQLDNPSATHDFGWDSRISDEDSVTVTIPVSSPGSHFIDIGYRKDGSGSFGSDCAWFKVID
jgi:fibronectin type 3 domain-containing protein